MSAPSGRMPWLTAAPRNGVHVPALSRVSKMCQSLSSIFMAACRYYSENDFSTANVLRLRENGWVGRAAPDKLKEGLIGVPCWLRRRGPEQQPNQTFQGHASRNLQFSSLACSGPTSARSTPADRCVRDASR